MVRKYWSKGARQKKITIIFSVVILALLFFLRDDYQPALLFLRKFIFIIVLCFTVLFFGLKKFRTSASTVNRIGILLILSVFFGVLYYVGWNLKFYDYMKTYNVFNSLNRVEIVELPLTQMKEYNH